MQRPADVRWTLRSHLVRFICLVNELQPVYDVLEKNNLSIGTLNRIVRRCSSLQPSAELPRLTDNGRFISRFLVRNCGNYLARLHPSENLEAEEVLSAADALNAALVREPTHTVFNRTQLAASAPRWVWDPNIYSTRTWERANIVQDIVGHERELGKFHTFTQGQRAVSMGAPPWRRQDLYEWQHTLRDVLQYRAGVAWMNAEIWAAPKGKDTGFHYDYDPHVLLFQVIGSRRFHVMSPQSGELEWEPLEAPAEKPIDYGTRWANPKGSSGERVFDTSPGSVMRIPNGWPHKVVYRERSLGFRVASWTQCQALSMWLGQRLCLLSTMVGTPRICFDDETYREYGEYLVMERGGSAV